jgi:hypothetical protein
LENLDMMSKLQICPLQACCSKRKRLPQERTAEF